MYSIIKRFYDKGLYTEDDVRKFVLSGKLSEEEYHKIVGTNG